VNMEKSAWGNINKVWLRWRVRNLPIREENHQMTYVLGSKPQKAHLEGVMPPEKSTIANLAE